MQARHAQQRAQPYLPTDCQPRHVLDRLASVVAEHDLAATNNIVHDVWVWNLVREGGWGTPGSNVNGKPASTEHSQTHGYVCALLSFENAMIRGAQQTHITQETPR